MVLKFNKSIYLPGGKNGNGLSFNQINKMNYRRLHLKCLNSRPISKMQGLDYKTNIPQ